MAYCVRVIAFLLRNLIINRLTALRTWEMRVSCADLQKNFVSNAIKFNTKNSAAVLRTRSENNSLILEVSDTGPGLMEGDTQKLFIKYARLSNKPTGGEKSSGLGLAICKKIIDLHNGKIGAHNNPDKGTTFWFQLPLS